MENDSPSVLPDSWYMVKVGKIIRCLMFFTSKRDRNLRDGNSKDSEVYLNEVKPNMSEVSEWEEFRMIEQQLSTLWRARTLNAGGTWT